MNPAKWVTAGGEVVLATTRSPHIVKVIVDLTD
jgi:hypothetical protein